MSYKYFGGVVVVYDVSWLTDPNVLATCGPSTSRLSSAHLEDDRKIFGIFPFFYRYFIRRWCGLNVFDLYIRYLISCSKLYNRVLANFTAVPVVPSVVPPRRSTSSTFNT
jgi:hypothetical protein